MNEAFLPEAAGEADTETAIYLEKDIFFNVRRSRLESPAAAVALNFRECILLRLLLRARVRKQAVIDAAWGDNGVVVTDASYHQLVRSLRKKFDEIGLPAQSIRTLPRFGLEYLREYPPDAAPVISTPVLPTPVSPDISMPVASIADALMSGASMPDIAVAKPAHAGTGRAAKWPLRLLMLILPFLVGLLIGHLGYRGSASAPKPEHAHGLAVSVSGVCAAQDPEDKPACNGDGCMPAFRALRGPPALQRMHGSTHRSQCT